MSMSSSVIISVYAYLFANWKISRKFSAFSAYEYISIKFTLILGNMPFIFFNKNIQGGIKAVPQAMGHLPCTG